MWLQLCYYVISFIFIVIHIIITLTHRNFGKKDECKNLSSRGCETKIRAAHRGYISEHPENTIGAITDAYNNGLLAELDVVITADNQLVVFHDSSCIRMTQSQSSLHIKKSSYSQLSNVSIPQNIFGMKYKSSSNISLFLDILHAIEAVDDTSTGIYLDLKGHSRSLFASKSDKIYNKLLIATLNKTNLVRNKNFMFYFASYNTRALYHLLVEWNKYINANPNDIVCQYTFTYYLGAGKVKGLEYLMMKTKFWYFLCPVHSFVCDDGLFNLYYDEIISKYEKDGIKVGFWQKYHTTHKEHAHIQIYNLPQEAWDVIAKNGSRKSSFAKDHSYLASICVYYVMWIAIIVSYVFILSKWLLLM